MLKNVASQKIGAQLVSATDGSAFTGSVTVSVTVDAGTQATGSVGSGACTHEGNGYHTYAPAQAETNGDLIAFTFTGTGAVPVTVQVYTLPTTGILAPATAGRTLVVDAAGLADANTVKLGPSGSGTAQTARDIGASVLVGDKTGFSLSNGSIAAATFAADAIDSNALAASAVSEIWASVADSAGVTTLLSRLTALRAGYLDNINNSNLASVPAFPSNFSSLGINASGHISRVTLTDTLTTYTGNTPQTGDAYARIGATGSGLTSLASASKLLKYVQLMARSDTANATDNATELTEINADGGSGAGDWNPARIVGGSALETLGAVIADNVGAILDDTGVNGVVLANNAITASKIATDAITSNGLAASAVSEIQSGLPTDASITTAILAGVIETGVTLKQALQVIGAAAGGKRSGSGTSGEAFYALNNSSTLRITSNLDGAGDGVPTLSI